MNGFDEDQISLLRRKLDPKHIRTRQQNGRELLYLEGWHVLAEANRIFGFDGWDRETLAAQCIWQAPRATKFACVYRAHVRIRVRAGDRVIVRDGSGTGRGDADVPAEAHDKALKEAETDATKRALATFGNRFGLALYDAKLEGVRKPKVRTKVSDPVRAPSKAASASAAVAAWGTTEPASSANVAPIKVSRVRDKDHLKSITAQPCLICGRTPSQAHHLKFIEPRALSRKPGDNWAVPLCGLHHREVHAAGKEQEWWAWRGVDPVKWAERLWARDHRSETPQPAPAPEEQAMEEITEDGERQDEGQRNTRLIDVTDQASFSGIGIVGVPPPKRSE